MTLPSSYAPRGCERRRCCHVVHFPQLPTLESRSCGRFTRATRSCTPRVTATARYNAAVPLELSGDALAEATSAPDAPAREYVDYVRPERRSGKSRLGV